MQKTSKEPTIDTTYNFEKVWATLDRLSERSDKETRELREQIREMSAETDKKFREMSAETDRQFKETDRKLREVGAHIDEVGANLDKGAKQMREEIGGIGKSNGFMAEDMFFNAFNKTKEYANRKFYEVEARISKSLKSEGKA
ncbi:MAG: hypothetical protein LBU51_03200, partial [Bacteroidales bacterium]|nr:hypothetical protein [Bacteroidales bacterium]